MTGIQCRSGHVFSMIIDSEASSAEWRLEEMYYKAQGCEIVVEDERFLNSSEVNDTLNFFEIKKDNKTNIKIWRDIV